MKAGKEKKETQDQGKQKSKAKKIASGVVTGLLVIILVFCVFVVIQVKTAKRPNLFGYGVYTVVSGSMVPTLEVGDVIIIKAVKDGSELQKGDIITFNGKGDFAGKVVTHRIVSDGVVDGKITTCGDANYGIVDKTPIGPEDVIGKYVRTSAVMTFIYSAFRSKVGFALIVFVPLLVLLIVQVVNFARACKMDKDGKPESESQDPAGAVKEKEEEIKRKAIEEYIASRKRIEEAQKKRKKD